MLFAYKNKIRDINSSKSTKIIAALDIGTSKVVCLIAKVNQDTESFEIIGIGHQASKGIRNGKIVDTHMAEKTIGQAVQSAEHMARHFLNGTPLSKIIVNVPAQAATVYTSSANIDIKGNEINEGHIQKALSHCQNMEIPDSVEVIHRIPLGFQVDETDSVKNPLGMVASSLQAQALEIAVPTLSLRNVANVVERNHLEVDFVCLSPYASGLACLVDDEMEMGTTLIDIGAGTSNIAIFSEGHLIYTDVIPIGGNHITSDIARGLTTPAAHAERIKTLYGSAISSPLEDDDFIDIPLVGETDIANSSQVPRSVLLGIMRPRLEEIFELIHAHIRDSGLADITGRRAVLTGGTSQLPGISEFASHMLDKQVRLGQPEKIPAPDKNISNPIFSTAIGLLYYGLYHVDEAPAVSSPYTTWSIFRQIGGWIKENW